MKTLEVSKRTAVELWDDEQGVQITIVKSGHHGMYNVLFEDVSDFAILKTLSESELKFRFAGVWEKIKEVFEE